LTQPSVTSICLKLEIENFEDRILLMKSSL